MVKNIVDTFYKLSEQHKLVRSFKYDRLSKGAGTGDELMPHVFLEDPIWFHDATSSTGTLTVTVNFDVVITPQLLENYGLYPSTETGQELCQQIGLNMIARLRQHINNDEIPGITSIVSWSMITLKHWYDNDCDGIRFTVYLNTKNELNFCDVDEHYDDKKKFDKEKVMSEFSIKHPSGCANFDYKLPKFDL